MTSEASLSALEAFCSPSAAITWKKEQCKIMKCVCAKCNEESKASFYFFLQATEPYFLVEKMRSSFLSL